MDKESINKWTLLLLVFFISAIFLAMIRQFLMAILLAGIFSALSYPFYRKFEQWLGGRRSLASIVTIVIIFFGVILPLGTLLGVVTGQAIKVGGAVTPWVQRQLAEPDAMFGILGLIIGPIIAALFVTVWDLYGIGFKEVLPAVEIGDPDVDERTPEGEMPAEESGFEIEKEPGGPWK